MSEVRDDLLMWGQYADGQRGAVIQLRCLPEKDTALCAAVQVRYSPDMPGVAKDAKEWVGYLFGEHAGYDDLFYKFAFTKSDDWKYEQEWRCILPAANFGAASTDLVVPNLLYEEEIATVYLGSRMPPEIQADIVTTVRERLPHVKLFKGRANSGAYKLEFDALD